MIFPAAAATGEGGMMNTITISAVAFEENGVWVVQGIEYDICAHAKDPAGVPMVFGRAVVENACITEHLGRKPLQGIKPAPAKFKEMFDRASTQVNAVKAMPDLPVAAMNIRLAEHA
jgi:hypothetical protein